MYRIFVKGIVQGVGFRPYVYRKAKQFGFVGSVKNIGSGVEIIVNDKDFIKKLDDLPPLAKIAEVSVGETAPKSKFSDFTILKSGSSKGETSLPPDIFTCKDCLRELRNKQNRRHHYYFITCTNCGPRFSMIADYPYDRPFTSMQEFGMCNDCKMEYENPLDRRYHAQTIACKKCGPKLMLKKNGEAVRTHSDAETIEEAVKLLNKGKSVSIKGVGGFHICSSAEGGAVRRVREALGRPHKPFAVMVRDLEKARGIAHVSEKEAELLESPQRPIVVLKKKRTEEFAEISELDSLGVMLPYTALHYLLFDYMDEPLVMTSCNFPGEPVSLTEKIGKFFLTHERTIVNRCDDSVLKVIKERAFFLRRSRGYAPIPIAFPIEVLDTLAVGAELNNAICTAKGKNCFLSQYVGDTSKLETSEFLKETARTFIRLSRLKPKLVACDMHPAYNSSMIAKEFAERYNAALIPIQHHKAHVAGVAAEYGLTDYTGIAMDGLGFGEDGRIWGGEVFSVKEGIRFERAGHLEEQPQLGGDSATIYPKKMLFGILGKFLDERELRKLGLFDESETELYLKALKAEFNVQKTTSAGRVLDAAAALLGFCEKRTYDGRPAIVLEAKAGDPYELDPKYISSDGAKVLDTTHLFEYLFENMDKDRRRLAGTAQMYLARGLFGIAKKEGTPIVFSGGVAYNRMISGFMLENGVLANKEVPAGDGGICYGQAYLANLLEKNR